MLAKKKTILGAASLYLYWVSITNPAAKLFLSLKVSKIVFVSSSWFTEIDKKSPTKLDGSADPRWRWKCLDAAHHRASTSSLPRGGELIIRAIASVETPRPPCGVLARARTAASRLLDPLHDASATAGSGELVPEPKEAAADHAPKQSSELKKILPLGLMFFFILFNYPSCGTPRTCSS